MTLEDRIGETLKHLQENIGAGACIGHYSKKASECRVCAVKSICKSRTEAQEADTPEEPEKPKKATKKVKKKASMKNCSPQERLQNLMEFNGAKLLNVAIRDNVHCFDFEIEGVKVRVIYNVESNSVKAMKSKENVLLFVDLPPETIVKKVIAFATE